MDILPKQDLELVGFIESEETPDKWINGSEYIQFKGKTIARFDLKGKSLLDLYNKIRIEKGEEPITQASMPKNPFKG